MLNIKEGKFACIEFDCKKPYKSNVNISKEDIEKCFSFALSMALGEKHNTDSFASNNLQFQRGKGTVFRDAFQGKIAEVAFYNYYSHKHKMDSPDFSEWERGKWEDTDFVIVNEKKQFSISIKSTKRYGNLLMLEKNRYDENGYYLEGINNSPVKHDLIFLIRVDGISSIKAQTYLDNKFKNISAEVTGYIEHNDFVKAINNNKLIEAGTYINGCEELKVDNYYFCAKELKSTNNQNA